MNKIEVKSIPCHVELQVVPATGTSNVHWFVWVKLNMGAVHYRISLASTWQLGEVRLLKSSGEAIGNTVRFPDFPMEDFTAMAARELDLNLLEVMVEASKFRDTVLLPLEASMQTVLSSGKIDSMLKNNDSKGIVAILNGMARKWDYRAN